MFEIKRKLEYRKKHIYYHYRCLCPHFQDSKVKGAQNRNVKSS